MWTSSIIVGQGSVQTICGGYASTALGVNRRGRENEKSQEGKRCEKEDFHEFFRVFEKE